MIARGAYAVLRCNDDARGRQRAAYVIPESYPPRLPSRAALMRVILTRECKNNEEHLRHQDARTMFPNKMKLRAGYLRCERTFASQR